MAPLIALLGIVALVLAGRRMISRKVHAAGQRVPGTTDR